MYVQILGEVLLQPQRGGVRTYPGKRSLHGLLHDLADLAGHLEAALAFHPVGFDEQHIATSRCPGQPNCHTRATSALSQLGIHADLDAAKELLDDRAINDQRARLAFRDAPCLLTAYGADQLFQLADACFSCVVTHDVANALFRKFDLRCFPFLGLDTVFLDLPRNEVAERDVSLLILGVARQVDDFHAVA